MHKAMSIKACLGEIMPVNLEWDVIKVPVGVMCRCPNTFVHIMYNTSMDETNHTLW